MIIKIIVLLAMVENGLNIPNPRTNVFGGRVKIFDNSRDDNKQQIPECGVSALRHACSKERGFCIPSAKDCISEGGDFNPNGCSGDACGCCVEPKNWSNFKKKYNKTYPIHEDHLRFTYYIDNKKAIKYHNSRGMSWTKGENEFTDKHREEFEKEKFGVGAPNPFLEKEECSEYRNDDDKGIESTKKNWLEEGAVTKVKQQGNCASCWAFAVVGSVEAQYYKHSKILENMSPQNLLDCAKNKGCQKGGRPENGFQYVMISGIKSEKDDPYVMKQEECKTGKMSKYFCKGCKAIAKKNEEILELAVSNEGPVAAIIDASHLQLYTGGVLDTPDCSSDYPGLNHAVLITGYNEIDGKEYWIVKNSWGTKWGLNGYFYLAKGRNMCGIATDAMFAEGPCNKK